MAPAMGFLEMNQLRIFWGVNFFFFALILIYLWSKVIIISRKINRMRVLIKEADGLKNERILLKKDSVSAQAATDTEPRNKE
jgi:hypothetical protein